MPQIKKDMVALKNEMVLTPHRVRPTEGKLHPALGKHLGYCLYKVALKFRTIIDNALLEEGIIAPQFGVLNILRDSDGLNQISLGLQMGIDKATVVKLIDGLEKLGYVVRVSSETDRREKYLKVTPRGIKFLDHIIPKVKALETDFLKPLDPEERKVLLGAIPKLMQPRDKK